METMQLRWANETPELITAADNCRTAVENADFERLYAAEEFLLQHTSPIANIPGDWTQQLGDDFFCIITDELEMDFRRYLQTKGIIVPPKGRLFLIPA